MFFTAKDQMIKAGEIVNERKREQEEADQQDIQDESDMRLILQISSTIKLMRMENGLNLLDYGRLRKAGDIVSYNDHGRVGDYAFIFDLMIVLCHRPKWLQHRYRFREAIKIRDHFLEPPMFQQHASSGKPRAFFSRDSFSPSLYSSKVLPIEFLKSSQCQELCLRRLI